MNEIERAARKVARMERAFLRAQAELHALVEERPLEWLGLEKRTHDALAGDGIRTFGGLLRLTEDELAKTPNLGRKRIREIREKLQSFGLTLRAH